MMRPVEPHSVPIHSHQEHESFMQVGSNPPSTTASKASNVHNDHFMQPLHNFPVQMPFPVTPSYNSSAFAPPASVNYSSVPYTLCHQDIPVEFSYGLPHIDRGQMHAYQQDARLAYDQLAIAASIESLTVSAPHDHLSSPVTAYIEPQIGDNIHGMSVLNQVSPSLNQGHQLPPSPNEPSLKFDGDVGTLPKRAKASTTVPADPYAASFLRDQLGEEKWEIFSSRLFERRFVQKPKHKVKGRRGTDEVEGKSCTASAIDFLVKVEVVKEILRTYVPHPYNPLKSLSHAYDRSPSGQVTLTRSTVLALSGWSNTQFSYWARRSEAVSVLSEHDPRLRAVAVALERRLRGGGCEETPSPTCSEKSDSSPTSLCEESVTGKGLDAIIEEVKKRTGASQFLRGKHSSLDPFGSVIHESEVDEHGNHKPPTVYMPTFQAQMYRHSPPPNQTVLTAPPLIQPPTVPNFQDDGIMPPQALQLSTIPDANASIFNGQIPASSNEMFVRQSPMPIVGRPRRATTGGSHCMPTASGELYPLSDSRSEFERHMKRRSSESASAIMQSPKKKPKHFSACFTSPHLPLP